MRRLKRPGWISTSGGFFAVVTAITIVTVMVLLLAQTHALVRLGALLATDAAPSSYQSSAEAALAAGASIDEIVGTVIAVAPTVGLARMVSAAPELALALGYDVDAALEVREDQDQG